MLDVHVVLKYLHMNELKECTDYLQYIGIASWNVRAIIDGRCGFDFLTRALKCYSWCQADLFEI